MTRPDGQRLRVETDRLLNATAGWSARRWRPYEPRMRAALQALADLDADAEGIERRPLPAVDNQEILPMQLAVLVDDLLRTSASDDALARAADIVTSIRR
ncbi:hypothetical protein [Fodinicola feengrottensis]|uniref:Uncharacterized protein n=1 Tax=Fodinicola feengrottensis TaxID=435914 RepID=A0ABN2HI97_9ACTN|nr:hypothetical protein [Fodinicola feengrottensis]